MATACSRDETAQPIDMSVREEVAILPEADELDEVMQRAEHYAVGKRIDRTDGMDSPEPAPIPVLSDDALVDPSVGGAAAGVAFGAQPLNRMATITIPTSRVRYHVCFIAAFLLV